MTVAAAVAAVAPAGREKKHGSYVDADQATTARPLLLLLLLSRHTTTARPVLVLLLLPRHATVAILVFLQLLLLPRHATAAKPV